MPADAHALVLRRSMATSDLRRKNSHLRWSGATGNCAGLSGLNEHSVVQVNPVLLVFSADRLENFRVGKQAEGGVHRKRSGVGLRVVDGDGQVHVTEVAPPEALLDPGRFAPRMSHRIEP